MAKGSAVPKERGRGADDERPARRTGGRAAGVSAALDRLIHERLRLGIVSALAVNTTLSFNELKQLKIGRAHV